MTMQLHQRLISFHRYVDFATHNISIMNVADTLVDSASKRGAFQPKTREKEGQNARASRSSSHGDRPD